MDARLGLGERHEPDVHEHPAGHDDHDHAHESHRNEHEGGHGDGHHTQPSGSQIALASDTAKLMAEAATTFLAALSPEQRQQVTFKVQDEERLNWHYVPKPRNGLALRDMDTSQQQLAYALLSSGLSRRGYGKAISIMSLEKVLGKLEGAGGRHRRDPEGYHFTVFGRPSDDAPWGWRVEGHHVSVNFLVVDGQHVAATPNFLGSNPARVPEGSLEGLRILAAEEDLARRLLGLLPAALKGRAVVAPEAPADILTRAEHHVHLDAATGLAARDMDQAQRGALQRLLAEYVERMPPDVADVRMNQIEKAGTGHIHFAWAGAEAAGQPHYYRLQGPSFLVEYDNTQNGANHIHTVWRDVEVDWGEDLLAGHYARSH
jgi:hypothetical protein